MSAALLIAVLALSHERRLRIGLQAILNRILKHWSQYAKNEDDRRRSGPPLNNDGATHVAF
jgi:hypothetical protein